ncbi:MAG TPA: sulfite exporter TauE/SafE family protein [Nevskiaceae bacterium]|nr:sulfite exporter TauE/SafE family protein [Nevskiaceae bacterium]
MGGPIAIAILSVPALFVAGAASGLHCALMCAPLHARLAARRPVALQAGRIAAYGVLGAIVGGVGAWWLRPGLLTEAAPAVRVAMLLGLAVALLLPLRSRACCARPPIAARPGVLRTFAVGFATGLAPCIVLYAALAYAALSGSAAQGGLLMIAFGLGTLPAVALGIVAWRRVLGSATPGVMRRVAAVAILATAATLAMVESFVPGGAWCVG